MNLEAFFETNTIEDLMRREDVRVISLSECDNWEAIAVNVTEKDGMSLLGTVLFLPGVDVSELAKGTTKSVTWN